MAEKKARDVIKAKRLEKKVTIAGFAQSNERVSELLRNLANQSPWLERPELIEIKSALLSPNSAKDAKIIYEFSGVSRRNA